MRETQNIQYIDSPNQEDFPNKDVAELVNILNKFSSTCSGVRHAFASLLMRSNALRNIPGAPSVAESVDPAHGLTNEMCEFRDQGNTIVAKDGNKTVGMIGFEEHPNSPSGERIFEIRRTTVLPEYRGRGIGRALRERLMRHLPSAILLSRIHKENTVNQNLAESTGFTKISPAQMEELGFSADWIKSNADYGYEFYSFKSQESKQQDDVPAVNS